MDSGKRRNIQVRQLTIIDVNENCVNDLQRSDNVICQLLS